MSVPPDPPPGYAPPPTCPAPEQMYAVLAETPRTGLATAALVLGIISIPTVCVCVGPFFGLLALILGIIAVVHAAGQPERYAERGRAVGGIVTGGVSLVLGVLIVVVASTSKISAKPCKSTRALIRATRPTWTHWPAPA